MPGAAILTLAIALAMPFANAHAAGSAANIPYSGISPGGVDMASGELILVMRPDLLLDGPMPVGFSRYYASKLASDGLATGHLGPNWLGTYDWSLSVQSGGLVNVVTNRGQLIQFQQNAVGGYDLIQPMDQKYRLASVGGTWRFTDPLRRELYSFDGTSGMPTQIMDEHGNTLSLSYAGGRLMQVSDGLGRSLAFNYSSSGLLTSVSDGVRSVGFGYTGGVLASVTDPGGHVWTYAYDPAMGPALLTAAMEPAGNVPLQQTYDPLGRVSAQMDAAGGNSIYAWGLPTGNGFTDPLGNAWSYVHDSQGRLLTLTDPASGVTSYAYDALGRLTTRTRPMGDPTTLAFDAASGYPSMITLADNSATSWGYGSHAVGGTTFFDLATANYSDGSYEIYGRDPSGNLTSFLDRGSFLWSGTYNARGQVLTSTNPANGVTTLTYDSQGRLLSAMDNAGNTTGFSYDGLSRLTQTTWPDASHRSYAYDNLDHMTGFTDERGKNWAYAYDANGRLTSETDPLNEATGYLYDGLDRMTQIVDPLGHARGCGFDPAGRVSSTTDASGRAMSYQYDGIGRLTGVTDPANASAHYAYDANGRLISAQDPLGHSTSFAYDALDRLTHVTDPVGTGFDYAYDSMGRLTSSGGPLEAPMTYGYDSRGLLALAHKATVELDFAHTPLGEISQLTDPNHNAWPRGYDAEGRMTSSADPLARTTSYAYDTRSRMTHANLPAGYADQTWDPASRVTGRSFSDGTTFTFAYDDANRLVGATGATFEYDAAGRMTKSNGLAFTYDPDGRLLSETFAPGKAIAYAYDNRGQLSQVTDWLGGTTNFSYDAAGRLTSETRPAPNGIVTTFQYDAADRLTRSAETPTGTATPIASITITRDVLGRPASIDRSQPLMPDAGSPSSTSLSYDAASETNGLPWDTMGRLLNDGTRAFQWDGASRLKQYTAGTESPSFSYDAFGALLASTHGSVSDQRAWNYGRGVATMDDMQVNQIPPKTSYYVRAPSGLLLYSIDDASGARTFYHYDESGNTMFLSNDAGVVTTEYAYDPLGRVSMTGQSSDNPFTWGAADGLFGIGGPPVLFLDGGGACWDGDARCMINVGGTFMHELGHNLGLDHGGRGTATNPREDYADEASRYWLEPDPLIGASPSHGMTIGGGPSEHVASDRTEIVTGDRTEHVSGDHTVHVGGGGPHRVSGGGTVHVSGDRGEQISGNGTIHVGDDGSERVTGDGTEHVAGDLTEMVVMDRTEHVSADRSEAVGGNLTHVIAKPPGKLHVGGFAVEDVSFDTHHVSGIGSTGGAGSGKVRLGEFEIKKNVDKTAATPLLECSAGVHYKVGTIRIRPRPSIRWVNPPVNLPSVTPSGYPHETISLNFEEVAKRYTAYDHSGSSRCTWCVK